MSRGRERAPDRHEPCRCPGETAANQIAPLPTLASHGRETLLLNLERVGALNVHGDRCICREFLNRLATELSHNTRSASCPATSTRPHWA